MSEPRNFYEALADWKTAREQFTYWQARERELRQSLFIAAFPEPREGTNNYALPTKEIFRGTHKITRKVEPDAIPVVRQMLQASGSNHIVDDFLKVNYDLSVEAYKQAPANVRAILDRMITSKPAMPHIEIIAPEEKKGAA